jgi:hypothetical protein
VVQVYPETYSFDWQAETQEVPLRYYPVTQDVQALLALFVQVAQVVKQALHSLLPVSSYIPVPQSETQAFFSKYV